VVEIEYLVTVADVTEITQLVAVPVLETSLAVNPLIASEKST
jgi:hypothetical protein